MIQIPTSCPHSTAGAWLVAQKQLLLVTSPPQFHSPPQDAQCGGEVSQTGGSLVITVFRGGGDPRVLIQDTGREVGTGSLSRPWGGSASRRRGQLLSRPHGGSGQEPGAPLAPL